MKVVLVWPPQSQLHDPVGYPPMGLMSIAGYLAAKNVPVEITNLAAMPDDASDEELSDAIPDGSIYGISLVAPLYGAVKRLVRLLKRRKQTVVVGGPHASIMPWDTYQDLRPNHLVIGDGEVPMHLLSRGAYGKKPSPLIIGDALPMEETPRPSRTALKYDWICKDGLHGAREGQLSTTVVTSRGCPYKCAYCSKYELDNGVRYRTAEQVYAEMLHIKTAYGIEHVRFIDDVFSMDRKRLENICRLIEPLKMTWMACARADSMDEKILRQMKAAGCMELAYGVESGSNEMLRAMNKGDNPQHIADIIQMTKDAGIGTKALLLFGFPGENRRTVEGTMEWMRNAKPDKYTFSSFVPLPGSAVFSHPERFGVRLNTHDFSRYWFYWDIGSKEGMFIEYQNQDEILKLRDELKAFLVSEEWRN